MHFADAAIITLVQDNLSTHKPASLYEAFPAPEARRLAGRFEWIYTPKHGSWLNMAESELGVLSSQCLDRHIEDKQTLINETGKATATSTMPPPIGSSQPTMHTLNSSTPTLHF